MLYQLRACVFHTAASSCLELFKGKSLYSKRINLGSEGETPIDAYQLDAGQVIMILQELLDHVERSGQARTVSGPYETLIQPANYTCSLAEIKKARLEGWK